MFKKIGAIYNKDHEEWYEQFEADTEHDINDIPACNPGSTVFVKSVGKTYTVGSDGAWIFGGGLPSGGTPYQQLVTDGDGNAKWEDRLAYVVTEEQVIFSQENIAFVEQNGMYFSSESIIPTTDINVGANYRVNFDGESYNCVAYKPDADSGLYAAPGQGSGRILIGNGLLLGFGVDTGEPFLIAYSSASSEIVVGTLLTNPSHTVSITKAVETVHTIPQVYLPKNYRVVFVITYDIEGNDSISCNCSYEELKSFCIGKSVPILGSSFDDNKVKELVYIEYNEVDAVIYLQFNSGVDGGILKLNYKQDGSITRLLQ